MKKLMNKEPKGASLMLCSTSEAHAGSLYINHQAGGNLLTQAKGMKAHEVYPQCCSRVTTALS